MQLIQASNGASSLVWIVRMLSCALLATALTLPQPASASEISELPAQLQEKINQAQQACSDFENGEFALEWGAIVRVDLDGDLRTDWVLNEVFFACSSAASLYCGTGGCMSHFFVGDVISSILNQGWDVVDLGPNRVLLTDVHGSQCGGINPTPCFTASAWDAEDGIWRSTAAEWEK
ncbi:hypothetical protein KL867_18915 [Ruegeria litorea]|uniref:Uncharacterized protein n=1 Tax=Falsiruegeria litorea TaxID=1280831 RepID=A0ABS5WVH3_9RHOB|nr:hypothetical protein [Falsiruegeria litorea]MBT3143139.1 hypothetical protein [Falsiruegeria litorea]